MKVVGRDEIRAVLDPEASLAAVAQAMRRYARGEAQQAAVGHLGFTDPPGDTHIKSAWLRGDDAFVVKLASTFYDNPRQGLPPGSGLMLVASARTGAPLALLHDDGELTDLRTAMAGAVAAQVIADPAWQAPTLGVVGAGVQAELQAAWIARQIGARRVMVWARRAEATDKLCRRLQDLGFPAEHALDLTELGHRADLIVTTTPAREPVLLRDMLRPGYRIVAVGADAPGKRELGPGVVAGANLVLADSRSQALDHGECAWARQEGLAAEQVIEIGALLPDGATVSPGASAVADLTGLGVQDVAIALGVWRSLSLSSQQDPS